MAFASCFSRAAGLIKPSAVILTGTDGSHVYTFQNRPLLAHLSLSAVVVGLSYLTVFALL